MYVSIYMYLILKPEYVQKFTKIDLKQVSPRNTCPNEQVENYEFGVVLIPL